MHKYIQCKAFVPHSFIPFSLISFYMNHTLERSLKPQGWWAHIRLSHDVFSPPPSKPRLECRRADNNFLAKIRGCQQQPYSTRKVPNTSLHKTIYIHVLPKVFDVHLNKNNRKRTGHNGGVHKNGFEASLQERVDVFFFLVRRCIFTI